MSDAREIRAMLQGRVRELIATLPNLAGGRYQGNVYIVRNPNRDDRSAGSFIIWTRGAAAGSYRDFATDEKGDVIDLVAYAHGRPGDRRLALKWSRDFLGLGIMSNAQRRAARELARTRAAAAERQASDREAFMRRRALALWMAAYPTLAGTPAELYLARRGIALCAVPNPELDLRFVAELEHWRSAQWENGVKTVVGPRFPAIVAAVRDRHGDLTAVHCTFLRRSGEAKADVTAPKLMLGSVRGSVIRVTRGPGNQTPEEAALSGRRDPLIIGEGLEDALTLAVACPEARVWAATSLANVAHVPIDHSAVASAIVAANNDWQQPQACELLERSVETLGMHGVPVQVMRAHEGNDFNDLVR